MRWWWWWWWWWEGWSILIVETYIFFSPYSLVGFAFRCCYYFLLLYRNRFCCRLFHSRPSSNSNSRRPGLVLVSIFHHLTPSNYVFCTENCRHAVFYYTLQNLFLYVYHLYYYPSPSLTLYIFLYNMYVLYVLNKYEYIYMYRKYRTNSNALGEL